MENDSHITWVLYVVIALLIGAGVGYWYGMSIGIEKGRTDLLADQEAAEKEKKMQAQEEIIEAANPFEDDNPIGDSYQNPFKQNTNPFAQ
jgi:hypothetical protein